MHTVPLGFSPLTGILYVRTIVSVITQEGYEKFQSPDGDSLCPDMADSGELSGGSIMFQSPDGDSLCPDSKMHHIHGGARKWLKFALLFCVNLCAVIISFLSSRLTSLDHICTTTAAEGYFALPQQYTAS